jgi:hypothetical protein
MREQRFTRPHSEPITPAMPILRRRKQGLHSRARLPILEQRVLGIDLAECEFPPHWVHPELPESVAALDANDTAEDSVLMEWRHLGSVSDRSTSMRQAFEKGLR